MTLPRILDNLIAQKRIPPIVLIQIANGGGENDNDASSSKNNNTINKLNGTKKLQINSN